MFLAVVYGGRGEGEENKIDGRKDQYYNKISREIREKVQHPRIRGKSLY